MKTLLTAIGLTLVICLDFTINIIGDHQASEISIELSKETSESETKEKSETKSMEYIQVMNYGLTHNDVSSIQLRNSDHGSNYLYHSPWDEIPYPPPEEV